MITQTISDPPTDCMRIESLDRYTEDTSSNDATSVTLEWIRSLPQELKDEALLRWSKLVEAKPTLVESFTLNQVLYRTLSGGTFTESADNVASRTGCDRKTVLKGLAIAVEQNILEKNERPGTSTEYSFKPVEEWLAEPVVRIKDTRTQKVIEFPTSHNESVETEQQISSNLEVVLNTDYLETDTNNNIVVVNKLLEQQQEQVSIPVEDREKTSPWKYVGQGLPRIYIAPELDQETGSKIESIHEATSRPRQFILKEAVDLFYNQVNRIPNTDDAKPAGFTQARHLFGSQLRTENAASSVAIPLAVVTTPTPPISKTFDASVELEDIDIDELGDVMTQIKLQLRIPVGTGMKDSIKRNWKGDTHFNNALTWCVETAEWLERENKLDKERLFGMLINAMKQDKKPKSAASEKLQNASAYSNKQPVQEPSEQQLRQLVEAKQNGLIQDLFDSAGDGVLKVIDRLGFAMPWYEWSGLQASQA